MKSTGKSTEAKPKQGNPFFLSPESTVYVAANPQPEVLPDVTKAEPGK